jgi:hypothetical protein
MKRRVIGMALPVALALASCDYRQQTWGGPIIPLQSVRLLQPVVKATPASSTKKWTGCSCRRHRVAATKRRPIAGSPPPQQQLRYPHVLTDPVGQGELSLSLHATSQAAAAPPPSQVGSWRVAGTLVSCSIHLSSQGLVDARRATVSGCQGSSLQNVNGWRMNGKSIELMEKGGHVSARFDGNPNGGFSSRMTDDGRSLTLYH